MKQYIFWSILCCTALASGHTLAACAQSPDCEAMGYKYTADECPNDGIKCPFDTSKYFCFDPQTCDYTYTAESCAANCQNPGASSCVRNSVTYYQSCGSSKCSSGQACSNGTCSPVATSGYCCGYSGCGFDATLHYNDLVCHRDYGISCYNRCMQLWKVTCTDMQARCQASSGTPVFQGCDSSAGGGSAKFDCQ